MDNHEKKESMNSIVHCSCARRKWPVKADLKRNVAKSLSSVFGALMMFVMFGLLVSCSDEELFSDGKELKINSLQERNKLKPDQGRRLSPSKGSYTMFLDTLRAFESDISISQAAYYEANYFNHNASSYPEVSSPGRVIRDVNGNPVYSTTSVAGLFQKLGVDDIYIYGSRDPGIFKRMQFACTNFLGFVGYQFSEQDLWVLGYYTHYDENGLKEYYSDLPNSTWANGVRDTIINKIHITDVNTWRGNFTGLHGINTFEDYQNPELQQYIALDHFAYKYRMIVAALGEQGRTIQEYIGTSLYWDQCTPKISPPPGGRDNEVIVTMSGLLAGAHLRGAAGVAALLLQHENHADEIGTTILQYVQDYGGYDTPY